jgi:hypothetical protein
MTTASWKWSAVAAGIALAIAEGPGDAKACSLEGCPNLPNGCYSYLLSNSYSNVLKWCQAVRKCTWEGCWLETHVTWGNASSYGSAVQAAVNSFNIPPRGPGNSLYLDRGGTAGSNDIDFWNTSTTDWWWGIAHWVDGAGLRDGRNPGCFGRGGGWVQLNTYRIPGDFSWQRWIVEHELGHEIGLGHVCTWGITMNPCTEGNNGDLSSCDAQGINSLYP